MEKSGIYGIRNTTNGKWYIGSTGSTVGFSTRWSLHKSSLNRNKCENSHLQRAWNKYGKDSFEFNILEECPDNMLIVREQAWMDYYDSMNRNNGYNIRFAKDGGKRIGSAKEMSEATKEKISNSLKEFFIKSPLTEDQKIRLQTLNLGRKHSPETIEKLSKSRDNGLTGKHHSDATKEKMSKAKMGKKYSDITKDKMSKAKKLYWCNRRLEQQISA
jgi:group I intron endonuclease